MNAAEIRSQFLKYFEKNGHGIVQSSSLVPQNDPTLLFTNAGMVQFKDLFLGKETRAYTRATSSQKCVRAGGKHNDLENVGFTARHHTFFEMLGNFSFGDYFKKEAIHYAWEFVTQTLRMPKSLLYVSVFENDDEAAEIWHKQEGVLLDRIFRFGQKDNFWAMGDTGPCGPCSELFIDRGEKYGCGKPTCTVGCDCDRFTEFWNLVFMQFERDPSGKLSPLPKPSVDTGAGLERIAAILQRVESNYDTDLFQQIIQKTAELSGIPYILGKSTTISFRVIADHCRATTFLISDGVLPSNEGRGYVLRRIMRRAIRHGRKLGFSEPFLFKCCDFVMDQMGSAYPDLPGKREFIHKVVFAEEDQFFKTLENGLALLDEEIGKLGASQTLSGRVAFKLYDTYGFPLDLTRVICNEKKIAVHEVGFEEEMEKQRTRSRKHWKGSGEIAVDTTYLQIAEDLRNRNQTPLFSGYENLSEKSSCLAILLPEAGKIQSIDSFAVPASEAPPTIEVIFQKTPFYGESGGQVGDRGRIFSDNGFEGEVYDTQKPLPHLIVLKVKAKKGTIQTGSQYTQTVDPNVRALTARNHTATHILQWALRSVLGNHVKQAGSLVSSELLRFDFTHFQALTQEELTQVENLTNEKIWTTAQVTKQEMPCDEAIQSGAIAFFGEKYGDRVRVVKVGDFSTELCGGTHVGFSSDIHLLKIASESGIAAGVRRIIAYTSKGAFEYLRSRDEEMKQIRNRLKASSFGEIFTKLDRFSATEKDLRQQIEALQTSNISSFIEEAIQNSTKTNHATLITCLCPENSQSIKYLREISDRIKQKTPDAIMVLGMKDSQTQRAFLLAATGPKAPEQIHAGNIIQELAPLIDGRGGGKPDLAQAGGSNPDGLENAIQTAQKTLSEKLKKM